MKHAFALVEELVSAPDKLYSKNVRGKKWELFTHSKYPVRFNVLLNFPVKIHEHSMILQDFIPEARPEGAGPGSQDCQ